MENKANTNKIISSAKKLYEDKRLVSAYLRGEVTKKTLDDRGVKLAMPL